MHSIDLDQFDPPQVRYLLCKSKDPRVVGFISELASNEKIFCLTEHQAFLMSPPNDSANHPDFDGRRESDATPNAIDGSFEQFTHSQRNKRR